MAAYWSTSKAWTPWQLVRMSCHVPTLAQPIFACGSDSVVSPPASPQAKRQRGGHDSPDQVGSTAAVPSPSPGVSLISVVGSPLAGHSKHTKGNAQTCRGCHRQAGVSSCYINPDDIVPWALPPNRGKFCKGCYATWRALHSGEHSLGLFPVWLGEHSNRRRFILELVAFLSLKKDGIPRITAGMIRERFVAFRFHAQVLELPLLPSVLMPLAEDVAKTRVSSLASAP